ncbi:MAG: exosortase Q [Variovorax sp.]
MTAAAASARSNTWVQHRQLLAWGIRLDRVPAWVWLTLQCLSLTPTWRWMARRANDGSDDPLGILALVALAVFVWQQRAALRVAPRLGWLSLALAGSVGATLLRGSAAGGSASLLGAAPPLVVGLIAVLAVACALLAFLPRQMAATPILGLAVLALPLLSSLQFYAGYPLRLVTAEASRWLLAPAFEVVREGSSLVIDGRLVIVDAPCSGVQMAWLGYFTACVVAAFCRPLGVALRDATFLARLPLVGALVLAGNIVRNSALVGCEGAGAPLAPWAHQALGLGLLVLVCMAIAWWVARPPADPQARSHGLILEGEAHAHVA